MWPQMRDKKTFPYRGALLKTLWGCLVLRRLPAPCLLCDSAEPWDLRSETRALRLGGRGAVSGRCCPQGSPGSQKTDHAFKPSNRRRAVYSKEHWGTLRRGFGKSREDGAVVPWGWSWPVAAPARGLRGQGEHYRNLTVARWGCLTEAVAFSRGTQPTHSPVAEGSCRQKCLPSNMPELGANATEPEGKGAHSCGPCRSASGDTEQGGDWIWEIPTTVRNSVMSPLKDIEGFRKLLVLAKRSLFSYFPCISSWSSWDLVSFGHPIQSPGFNHLLCAHDSHADLF